jgi:hypothetical protein
MSLSLDNSSPYVTESLLMVGGGVAEPAGATCLAAVFHDPGAWHRPRRARQATSGHTKRLRGGYEWPGERTMCSPVREARRR